MRKDFIVTCMDEKDDEKKILLLDFGDNQFQATREEALYYACELAKQYPHVSYMVMSLRGCKPHKVVQHDILTVEGLE